MALSYRAWRFREMPGVEPAADKGIPHEDHEGHEDIEVPGNFGWRDGS
jgi:hypothetical protein